MPEPFGFFWFLICNHKVAFVARNWCDLDANAPYWCGNFFCSNLCVCGKMISHFAGGGMISAFGVVVVGFEARAPVPVGNAGNRPVTAQFF
jgi:hypothetical protein